MNSFRVIHATLRKDLFLNLTGGGYFLISLLFNLSLLLLFRFTLPPGDTNADSAVSVLWAVFFISGLQSVLAASEWEWENFAYRAVKLAVPDQSVIFIGKALALTISIFLMFLIELAFWQLFFAEKFALPELRSVAGNLKLFSLNLLVGALSSFALALCGQVMALIAIHTRFRQLMLVILFLPISFPVLVSAAGFTRAVLAQVQIFPYLALVSAFIMFFLAAGIVLYGFFTEE